MLKRLENIINPGLRSLKEKGRISAESVETVLRSGLLHLFFNNESLPATIQIYSECEVDEIKTKTLVHSYIVNLIRMIGDEKESRKIFLVGEELVQLHNPDELYESMVPLVLAILSYPNCLAVFHFFFESEDQTLTF